MMDRFLVVMLVFLMSITVSCQKKEESQKKLHQLRVNISREPATLDPRKGGDLISSSLHFMLFEGLTRLNPDSTISLAQAESVDISDDRTTYTFHIRDSKWSDGSPVTAYDFEKSWKDVLNPQFPALNAHLLYPIKNAEAAKKGMVSPQDIGIKAKDAKTLVIELSKPTPYFLELTAFCVLFPVNHLIDESDSSWAYNAGKNFVSNGPFKLTKWKHNNEVVLEKNEFYWESNKVALDTISISMVDNEMTSLHLFENGQLDFLGMPLSPLPVDALSEQSEKGILQVRPIGATTICVFNTEQFPFHNVNLRKAFSYAINRESIVKNITQLHEPVATGAIPPVLKRNKITNFFKDADVLEARRLFQKAIEELGIEPSDLKEIAYSYTSSELNHKIAQAIQQQWLEVLGVQVALINTEHKVLLDKLSKRNYTIAQTQWIAQYSDQMNILERFRSKLNVKNYPGWENREFSDLLDFSSMQTDVEERYKILEQAEALFLDEMPVAPIFHWNYAFMQKPYLKNFEITPIGNVNFEQISINQ